MHAFISQEYQDIGCQILRRLIQDALSYRRKSSKPNWDRRNVQADVTYVKQSCSD